MGLRRFCVNKKGEITYLEEKEFQRRYREDLDLVLKRENLSSSRDDEKHELWRPWLVESHTKDDGLRPECEVRGEAKSKRNINKMQKDLALQKPCIFGNTNDTKLQETLENSKTQGNTNRQAEQTSLQQPVQVEALWGTQIQQNNELSNLQPNTDAEEIENNYMIMTSPSELIPDEEPPVLKSLDHDMLESDKRQRNELSSLPLSTVLRYVIEDNYIPDHAKPISASEDFPVLNASEPAMLESAAGQRNEPSSLQQCTDVNVEGNAITECPELMTERREFESEENEILDGNSVIDCDDDINMDCASPSPPILERQVPFEFVEFPNMGQRHQYITGNRIQKTSQRLSWCKLCDTFFPSVRTLKSHITEIHNMDASRVNQYNHATWDLEIAKTYDL